MPTQSLPAALPQPARAGRRRLGAAVTGLAVVATALVVPAALSIATASAATPAVAAHDPIGAVSTVKAFSGGISMTGWAADPDARTSKATVAAVLDGTKTLASARTSVASAAVTKKYRLGATPGFAISIPVPAGKHSVCLVVKNVKAGLYSVLRCVATPLGRTMSSASTAAHNPVGRMTSAWANSKSVHYRGWVTDPDLTSRRVRVVLYVDGSPAATVNTATYPSPRPANAGHFSKFDVLVPVTTVGTHVGCLWAVNVGFGTNAFLGCKAVDNRAPHNAAVRLTKAPSANAKFMALALKQKGKPYVWGATGPKSFDCSGLTGWVMKTYGYSIPRVSQDQIKAARLIPASHVQPGDLVFLHDSQGDVYHVGFYSKPGQMFAAIQPGDGVNYQNLWDPSSVTYGSFTHT